jgi:hypothetical protein
VKYDELRQMVALFVNTLPELFLELDADDLIALGSGNTSSSVCEFRAVQMIYGVQYEMAFETSTHPDLFHDVGSFYTANTIPELASRPALSFAHFHFHYVALYPKTGPTVPAFPNSTTLGNMDHIKRYLLDCRPELALRIEEAYAALEGVRESFCDVV